MAKTKKGFNSYGYIVEVIEPDGRRKKMEFATEEEADDFIEVAVESGEEIVIDF